jgi:HSP20 family protein
MERKTMTPHAHAEEKSLRGRDPFFGLRGLTGMSELFDDLLNGRMPGIRFATPPREWTPRVDIQETDKEYVLTASLPGVKKDDVKVSVEEGVLTIAGERREEKEDKGKTWLRQESVYGSFQRSFVLPAGMHPEEVKASHKDGQLIVTLRKPAQPKARGIAVKVE